MPLCTKLDVPVQNVQPIFVPEDFQDFVQSLEKLDFPHQIQQWLILIPMLKVLDHLLQQVVTVRIILSGNALARVQQVHEPADLWDITFCTR